MVSIWYVESTEHFANLVPFLLVAGVALGVGATIYVHREEIISFVEQKLLERRLRKGPRGYYRTDRDRDSDQVTLHDLKLDDSDDLFGKDVKTSVYYTSGTTSSSRTVGADGDIKDINSCNQCDNHAQYSRRRGGRHDTEGAISLSTAATLTSTTATDDSLSDDDIYINRADSMLPAHSQRSSVTTSFRSATSGLTHTPASRSPRPFRQSVHDRDINNDLSSRTNSLLSQESNEPSLSFGSRRSSASEEWGRASFTTDSFSELATPDDTDDGESVVYISDNESVLDPTSRWLRSVN